MQRYGRGDATLNVRRKGYTAEFNQSVVIWTDKNNYGDLWVYGSVSLPTNFSSSYTLILEAISGPSAYGDIGLDDLKITQGALCPSKDSQCAYKCPTNNQCVPLAKVCNFISDCPNGEDEIDCGYNNITFENSTGKWVQSDDGLFKWVRDNGVAQLPTGPFIGNFKEII